MSKSANQFATAFDGTTQILERQFDVETQVDTAGQASIHSGKEPILHVREYSNPTLWRGPRAPRRSGK
ncbi:hypothetical protein MTBLM5_140026 [Magnetospirillum sp. LM-5]|uniref:hypothetical protein n=1 Tax=Magnetospirillum sp. LM-5 TaxID=2681466 RepID=UPI001385BD93|nr:hypothetical protein [Magnetospirillum sp. LM-5]CAA7614707.1 hypothetical protein MTBLM5_140026 [Magnetospirillum sp. LM-5]